MENTEYHKNDFSWVFRARVTAEKSIWYNFYWTFMNFEENDTRTRMHCLLSHPIAVNFSRLISALLFTVIVTKEQRLCLWLIIKAIRCTDWFGGLDVNQVWTKGTRVLRAIGVHRAATKKTGGLFRTPPRAIRPSWRTRSDRMTSDLSFIQTRLHACLFCRSSHSSTESSVPSLSLGLCLCLCLSLMLYDAAFLRTLSIVIGGTRRLLVSPGAGGMFVAVCHSLFVCVCVCFYCWYVMPLGIKWHMKYFDSMKMIDGSVDQYTITQKFGVS